MLIGEHMNEVGHWRRNIYLNDSKSIISSVKKKYKTKLLMHYCLVAVRHFWQTTLFFSFPPSLFLSPSLSLFTQKCNLNTRVRPKRIWELDKWTSGWTYRYIYGVCPLRDSLLIPHGLIWRLHHYSHESISQHRQWRLNDELNENSISRKPSSQTSQFHSHHKLSRDKSWSIDVWRAQSENIA